MLIVQAPEHVADNGDEPALIGGRYGLRSKRCPEGVPVDLFVVKVGVLAVERAPQRIELRGEVGRRDR
jgi:hypothetical protein